MLVARLAWAQPARDDKVVTSWNGLQITPMLASQRGPDDPRWRLRELREQAAG